jgi:heterodisulfide reductase subunit B
MAELKLRSRDLFSDLDLGVKMLQKRKFPLLPNPTRRRRTVKALPGASRKVAYYPGCSLHATAPEFNTSARAVGKELGLDLVEPQGWVCCGSSAAHRADPEMALRLPMENLALIEQSGFQEVTMPCAACFNRHKVAQFEMRHDEDKRKSVESALDYSFKGQVQVNSLVQTIYRHVGPEKLSGLVKQPLNGLRLVCYYGCLLTRPPQATESPHPENPTDMDELMAALGAEVHDWSYKTSCCGAAHSLTRPDIVLKLSSTLIEQARLAGADLIAVGCPLCHTNLDARQFQMGLEKPMPILYFTQLIALALRLPAHAAALEKNLIDPRPVLQAAGLQSCLPVP